MAELSDSGAEATLGALEPPPGVTPNLESKSYYSTIMVTILLPITSIFVWWTNIIEMVYSPTISIAKLSILLMYLRLFMPARQGKTYYLTQFILWSQLSFYLAIFIVTACQCIPRRKIWEPFSPGHCVRADVLLTVTAVVNVVSDFSILLLPIGCIWRLQMPWKKKIGISAVFATGSIACIASVMRIVVGLQSYNTGDSTYTSAPSIHWTYAEIVIGIICGCMPVVPKFISYLVPKITSRFSIYPRPRLKRIINSVSRKANCNEPRARQYNFLELPSFTSDPGLTTVVNQRFRDLVSGGSDWTDDKYQDLERGPAQKE
ncbi:MAG: hypothetical protein Q9163_003712 [Psora crenata]